MDSQVEILEGPDGFSVRLTLGPVRTKDEAQIIREALLDPRESLPRRLKTLRQRPLVGQGQLFPADQLGRRRMARSPHRMRDR